MLHYHFCTYFDRHYLYRGLALYRSLERHASDFTLWVLTLDDLTYQVLASLHLPRLRPLSLPDFERGDAELLQAKANRSLREYYWTITPSLIRYVFAQNTAIHALAYLDADLFFFSSPEPIYTEWADNSILIIPHRYSPRYQHFAAKSGIYNVGLLLFRRDDEAQRCVEWWRARCNEWCYARFEDGKFGDQKYLDDWPVRFKNVTVLSHQGSGLAPWNLAHYTLTQESDMLLVDKLPLVFFHFHDFVIWHRCLYEQRHYTLTPIERNFIFRPYLQSLQKIMADMRVSFPDFRYGIGPFAWRPVIGSLLHRRFILRIGQRVF